VTARKYERTSTDRKHSRWWLRRPPRPWWRRPCPRSHSRTRARCCRSSTTIPGTTTQLTQDRTLLVLPGRLTGYTGTETGYASANSPQPNPFNALAINRGPLITAAFANGYHWDRNWGRSWGRRREIKAAPEPQLRPQVGKKPHQRPIKEIKAATEAACGK